MGSERLRSQLIPRVYEVFRVLSSFFRTKRYLCAIRQDATADPDRFLCNIGMPQKSSKSYFMRFSFLSNNHAPADRTIRTGKSISSNRRKNGRGPPMILSPV